MVVVRVGPQKTPPLRLLALHGHGGTPERLCGQLEELAKVRKT